jgi:hypothetical protein
MTLDHLRKINQEKQEALENRHSKELAAVALRARKWIAAKDPSLAKPLVGVTDSRLVLEELTLTYKRNYWSSYDNNEAINSILYPENITGVGFTVIILFAIFVVFIPVISATFFPSTVDNPSRLMVIDVFLLQVNILVTILYIITLIVRWLQKMLVVRCNLDLAWYAPICYFLKIEKEYQKERNLLLIEAENIKTALQQEEAQKLREEKEVLGQKTSNPATMSGVEFNEWLNGATADELDLFGSSTNNI